MKVKVLKEFKDVHTNEVHKVNTTFECTKERLTEIQSVSKTLVSEIKEKAVSEKLKG